MSLAVQQMFARIANRYDVTNDVLSMGIHRLWRRQALDFARVGSESTVLDFCTGTGDFAFCLSDKVGKGARINAVDFVPEMVAIAKQKLAKSQPATNAAEIEFSTGDAMSLAFPDDSFELATVGFGIRNVDDPLACMSEVKRVLKSSGRLLVLEFGQPRLPGFSWLYRQYSRFLMPVFGGLLTGDREAYEYLPKTASQFPDGERFASMMKKAGFEKVRWKSLFFGIAYIYVGSNQQAA